MKTEIPPTLTNAHRCDRCGARAYVLVYFHAKGFLYFCIHHFNLHETAIFAQGAALIHDKRHELAQG
jgi:hypothetical protein